MNSTVQYCTVLYCSVPQFSKLDTNKCTTFQTPSFILKNSGEWERPIKCLLNQQKVKHCIS